MNSGYVLDAVAKHLNWRQGTLVPEAQVIYRQHWVGEDGRGMIGGCEYLADLMWVTRDRYATEFEIKVSRGDWKADLLKGKWRALPPWVTRFIYAVPVELGIPEWVPAQAGVWHIHVDRRGYPYARIARPPKRIGKEKVPEGLVEKWEGHLYYRYWYNLLHRRTLKKLPIPAAAEAA